VKHAMIRPERIVIAGAGIAGSILATALRPMIPGRDVICIDRAIPAENLVSGTGLNIGPNAVKTLRAFLPRTAEVLERHSLPWREWIVALTDGQELMRLRLSRVADNYGLRLRWSEVYRLLQEPSRDFIRFGQEIVGVRYASSAQDGPLIIELRDRTTQEASEIRGVNLLIGTDGRFSRVRRSFVAAAPVRHLGVALYRLLIQQQEPAGEIDDYVQYFNGPNRLLAFRLPDGAVYLAGSFPIAPGELIADGQKTALALRALYQPSAGEPCAGCRFLLDGIRDFAADIRWSRLHDEPAVYHDERGHILLLGDAAHPMVPTLGQGATQTIEDACVAQEELHACLRVTDAIPSIVARRAYRVSAATALSWEASDTMLAGADPIAGTERKCRAEFLDRLASVYRDTPEPRLRRTA
jgi:2-polyprenyl-6-methoxyphenol hydroxylase-like FAD-dependent oxidoreductase